MTLCSEEWKDITGYEGYYMVSNLGRVKSCDRYLRAVYDSKQLKRGQILKPHLMPNGYYTVWLNRDGKRRGAYIHRLVAAAFIPNPSSLDEINHIDEDKGNNRADNLEWCSHRYNINYGGARERIGRTHHLRGYGSIPVAQCDRDGKVIQTFRSAADACAATGIDSSSISKVCYGKPKFKTAGGFIWKHI